MTYFPFKRSIKPPVQWKRKRVYQWPKADGWEDGEWWTTVTRVRFWYCWETFKWVADDPIQERGFGSWWPINYGWALTHKAAARMADHVGTKELIFIDDDKARI